MARPQTVNQLPDHIKQELNKKLTENSFSGYVQLAEWLNAMGYAVSKSSVHRYAERRQLSLIADSDAPGTTAGILDIKIRCLDIAARCLKNDGKVPVNDVTNYAESLMSWLYDQK
ncbi:phage protein Gp27 family protein [Proteus mirabilis]|uniref:phage protein Gp27 family protein n=2 Tax=Proteus TaxID=583 RepID=UPI001378CADA|nr:phage protein Gp27 family protein [Proteus mirabilis]EKC6284937.1 DUF3486 family protein [Escherichia coli]ELL8906335.1 DUF3486 family protein [Proteus mirabilis]MBQ0360543.1 DUF3486 family protein [Proteus mirabilis]NBM91065.1 DUF3486 family protein [Proteus sp. G2658]